MKKFYVLFLVILLASCGAQTTNDTTTATESENTNEVLAEVDAEIENLDTSATNEVVVLDAAYNNPNGPVDMKIAYAVDAEGVITSMEVTATTYDMTGFNGAAQELVGKTLTDAENFYVAGGSLTSDAFASAIKNR